MPFYLKTPRSPASMKAMGFTQDYPYGADSVDFLKVINKIISSHLGLTSDELDSLQNNLGVCLHAHSICSAASMDVMGHPQSWTKPRLLPESPLILHITPLVIVCLAKIAKAMKYACSDNYYITADTSFTNIDAWTTSVSSLLSAQVFLISKYPFDVCVFDFNMISNLSIHFSTNYLPIQYGLQKIPITRILL